MGKGNSKKVLLEHGGEKVPNWECLFVNRAKGPFLSVYVDDIKMAGKKQNLDPMWKTLIWEKQYHSLITSIWVALNESAKRAKILSSIKEMCLNKQSLQEQKKSYLSLRNLAQTFPHCPMIWKVMQRNVWSDIANWRTEQLNSYTNAQLHA